MYTKKTSTSVSSTITRFLPGFVFQLMITISANPPPPVASLHSGFELRLRNAAQEVCSLEMLIFSEHIEKRAPGCLGVYRGLYYPVKEGF